MKACCSRSWSPGWEASARRNPSPRSADQPGSWRSGRPGNRRTHRTEPRGPPWLAALLAEGSVAAQADRSEAPAGGRAGAADMLHPHNLLQTVSVMLIWSETEYDHELWPASHPAGIIRSAAAFRRDPVDVLRRVLDVACFAVDAVLRVDLQPRMRLPRRRRSRRRRPGSSALRGCGSAASSRRSRLPGRRAAGAPAGSLRGWYC